MERGFGLVETIVAVALWAIVATTGISTILGGFRANRLGDEETKATIIASEGIEGIRSLFNQGWTTPFLGTNCTTSCGLATASGTWAYSGTNNVLGKFTRTIQVVQSNRDGSGNIVDSGGTADSDTYKVTSSVTWNFAPTRTNTVTLNEYFTNFRKIISTAVALLIYGDGTTTPKTRDYDKTTDTFSAQGNTVTGASGLTFQLRASPTKREAVAGYVTNGGVLQIMCYDGATWTNEWSVTVGGAGTTRRFDIAYETNSGDVMVLYSTNTATTNELAFRTKPGSANCGTGNWAAATNLDPVRTSGVVQWVKLAWDKRSSSNLITAIWADANSDLSAMVWSGTAWGNEPSAALATTLQVVAAAQDVEDFDVEYESVSGNVMVIWGIAVGNNTNGVRYARCTGGTATCTWSAVTTPPTFADDATNLDLSANPNSNEMAFASVGMNQNDLQIGYWSGSVWTDTANADTSCNTPAAGTKLVSNGWLVSGGTSRSIIRYADQGSSAIDWYTGNAGVFNKEADFTATPSLSNPNYFDIQTDPISKDQLMVMASNSSLGLYAKRLAMTATPTFTWTNSDGAALTTTLPQGINSPFAFAYWRQ